MHDALLLFGQLEDQDVQWFLETGHERQVISRTVVVREGTRPDALYFVLEGLMGVTIALSGARQLGTLGPGDLFGEISWLEHSEATATVSAIENSLLLAVPFVALTAKAGEDAAFAARLFKALARLSTRRLRDRVRTLSMELQARASQVVEERDRDELAGALYTFKSTLDVVDRDAIQHGAVPAERRAAVNDQFRRLILLLDSRIGDRSGLPQHVREEIGERARIEMHPYVLLANTAERCYSKPRGYAGDFLTIEWLYRNEPKGTGRVGPLVDELFLQTPPARAVRNRRGLLTEEIRRTCETTPEGPVRITSLASGPAAEVFDALRSVPDASRLHATLLDIDAQALEFVAERTRTERRESQIDLLNGNLVYLATGRQKLDLPPQDLVYSIGLIDYFNDGFVRRLLNFVHGLLRPGGRVILGNFHPSNTTKAFMDHVLDWKLIHRSEDDMNRLYCASRFGRPCTRLRFEEEGINLFAECVKGEA